MMEEPSVKISQVFKRSLLTTLPIILIILIAQFLGSFQSLENDLFDFKTKIWRQNKTLPSDALLVLIDEASLSALEPVAGRWPWQRGVWADLIEYLTVSGARAIVFDVLFTELSDSNSTVLGESDWRLVESTRSAGNIIHASQLVDEHAVSPGKASSIHHSSVGDYNRCFTGHPNTDADASSATVYWPFKGLDEAAADIGVASFQPDRDGVYRRAQLTFQTKGAILPSISLVTVLKQYQNSKIDVHQAGLLLRSGAATRQIPLDHQGLYRVNLYGAYEAYSFSGVYASLMHLRQGDLTGLLVPPDVFKDKVVFIGASAAGVEDLKTTALGQLTPGVLLHASIYGNIVTDDMLRQVPWYGNMALSILSVFITAFAIFYFRRIRVQILCAAAVLVFINLISFFAYPQGLLFQIVPAQVGILAAYVSVFTWIGFSIGREKRKIKNVLGQYVSPAILSSVLTDHTAAFLEAEVGQRRLLSIQFSDLRGFTAIAEKYPVEQVVAMLNDYLASMVDVIFEYQGTLDKFIGDAILAFWGAPIEDPDHAFKSVCSAMEMLKALEQLNQRNQNRGFPRLASGFGIHTGEVILGNIGSQKKLDFTVIGDGVNLASRLESLTKKYHCPIVFTQQTYEAVRSRICCRIVDKVAVKGKQQSTPIYQPLELMEGAVAETLQIADLTNEAFGHYCRREFSLAARAYRSVLKLNPEDALSHLFVDRCIRYEQNPPPVAWLGECILDHK